MCSGCCEGALVNDLNNLSKNRNHDSDGVENHLHGDRM